VNSIISLDHAFFKLINQAWSNEAFDIFFPFITDLHKTLGFNILLLSTLIILHIFKFKKWGPVITLLCLISLAATDFLGNEIFKKNFARKRPFEITELQAQKRSPARPGSGFISNHSANVFALATFNALIIPAVAPYFFSIAILVAYSRVYNGVHFPSDVIAGALWGTFISYIIYLLLRKILLPLLNRKRPSI
jgi:undecaprenyl-diphosphatase